MLKVPINISEGFFKDKGSKFISFLIPVEQVSQVDDELKKLRKTYFDARHVCYAWRIGDPPEEKANDDGEPNYSAGAPILRRLKSHQLSNALLAVVRYFGGTKLGVPGLINAYETAAEEAIICSIKKDLVILSYAKIIFSYDESASLSRILSKLTVWQNLQVIKADYQEQCTFILEFPAKNTVEVLKALEDWEPEVIEIVS